MLRLLVFILAVYGAAAAVTVLRAGAPIRWIGSKLGEEARGFTSCPACVGFWLGCAMSAFVFTGPALSTNICSGIDWSLVVVDGLLSCGTCWIIHVLLVRLGMYDI